MLGCIGRVLSKNLFRFALTGAAQMFWFIVRRLKGTFRPLLESAYRFKDRVLLALLAITGRSTVKEVLNLDAMKSGKVVIFATFPAEQLAPNHIRLLKKLEARGYSIVVVSNHPRASVVLAPALNEAWTFVFRRPYGRDFGCYKDASLLIYQRLEQLSIPIERVILLNDSVMTFANSEDGIVAHLDDAGKAFAGVTENYEFSHHIGSFMVAISGAAFTSKRVRKFWKKYRPLSTREYSIGRGEFGLTKALKRSGFVPHVLFTVSRMKQYLEGQSFETLDKISRSMEAHFLKQADPVMDRINRQLNQFIGAERESQSANEITIAPQKKSRFRKTSPALTPSSGSPGIQGEQAGLESGDDFDHRTLRLVRYRERFLGIQENAQSAAITERAKSEIAGNLAAFVFKGSQVHHGAAILLFMGAGLIKKDVVFRQIVEPYNLEHLLSEAGACSSAEEAGEVMHEILAKGHPYSLKGFDRLLYYWGFI